MTEFSLSNLQFQYVEQIENYQSCGEIENRKLQLI